MIRALALDDDNHSCMFVTEVGVRYNNACEFICECLAKPHIEEYDVRGFCIIEPGKPLADLEDDVIDDLFYFMEGCGSAPEGISFKAAFDLMWNSSQKGWRD